MYLFLVALQAAGAAIILVNGAPIYRQMVKDFSRPEPHPGIGWWAVAAVAIMQGAYWLRIWHQPPLPQCRLVLASHLTSFLARLSFILASASFTVMFLVRFEELQPSLPRVVLLLAALFALFCYTLELERLAKALRHPEGKP